MLEASVRVVKIENHHIYIESSPSSTCGACPQKTGCASHALGGALKVKAIPLACHLPVDVGDSIVVGMEEMQLLRAAAFCYLLPLLGLFVGAGLADGLLAAMLPYRELLVIGSSVSCFALTLYGIKRWSRLSATPDNGLVIVKKE
jgi:sigma-E factor negative regulatory protein RseC